MFLSTRRPALTRVTIPFSVQLAVITAIGYASVAICSKSDTLSPYLGLIGPMAAAVITYCGYLLLRHQPLSSLGAISGIILGSSLSVGITMLLGGVSLPIAFQAVGIAGGISSIIGMRFGWKATIPSAIIGGLCAAAGAAMLPTMLEKGSIFAWVVNILGSAAATYWLGVGITKVCALENPVAWQNVLTRLQEDHKPEIFVNPEAIKNFIETPEPEVKNPTNPDLTTKELEVLKLLAVGHSDRKMGIILGLSENGVRGRLETARKKLQAKNRTELIAKAVQYEIIAKVAKTPVLQK